MKYVLCVYLPGILVGLLCLVVSLNHGLWPFVLLGWALVSGLGIAVGFHRVFSHKTHSLSPWMNTLLLVLGTLGGQGSSVSWVAVHRGYHHKYSDQPQDLHSPSNGYWNALVGWYWNMTPNTVNHKYAVDLLRYPLHVWFHKNYIMFMVVLQGALGFLSLYTGWYVYEIYMSVLFLSLVQDNAVNVVCHTRRLGYKNYPTTDQSVNNFVLGYLGWGQGWHENHHAEPATFDFGRKWWEFDPCRLWRPLLNLGATESLLSKAK